MIDTQCHCTSFLCWRIKAITTNSTIQQLLVERATENPPRHIWYGAILHIRWRLSLLQAISCGSEEKTVEFISIHKIVVNNCATFMHYLDAFRNSLSIIRWIRMRSKSRHSYCLGQWTYISFVFLHFEKRLQVQTFSHIDLLASANVRRRSTFQDK
jgi:hypothetical protein